MRAFARARACACVHAVACVRAHTSLHNADGRSTPSSCSRKRCARGLTRRMGGSPCRPPTPRPARPLRAPQAAARALAPAPRLTGCAALQLSNMWKAMGDDEKQQYVDKAAVSSMQARAHARATHTRMRARARCRRLYTETPAPTLCPFAKQKRICIIINHILHCSYYSRTRVNFSPRCGFYKTLKRALRPAVVGPGRAHPAVRSTPRPRPRRPTRAASRVTSARFVGRRGANRSRCDYGEACRRRRRNQAARRTGPQRQARYARARARAHRRARTRARAGAPRQHLAAEVGHRSNSSSYSCSSFRCGQRCRLGLEAVATAALRKRVAARAARTAQRQTTCNGSRQQTTRCAQHATCNGSELARPRRARLPARAAHALSAASVRLGCHGTYGTPTVLQLLVPV
jgi:hypothetical protein